MSVNTGLLRVNVPAIDTSAQCVVCLQCCYHGIVHREVPGSCLRDYFFQRSMVALAMLLFLSSVLWFLVGHLMVADIFRILSNFLETVNRDIRQDNPCFRPVNNVVFSMLVRHS